MARALDAAAERWPADRMNRAKLLAHLIEEGHRAVAQHARSLVRDRQAAVARTAGALTGAYADGYLNELREDWPE
jgi:hypothetical protein